MHSPALPLGLKMCPAPRGGVEWTGERRGTGPICWGGSGISPRGAAFGTFWAEHATPTPTPLLPPPTPVGSSASGWLSPIDSTETRNTPWLTNRPPFTCFTSRRSMGLSQHLLSRTLYHNSLHDPLWQERHLRTFRLSPPAGLGLYQSFLTQVTYVPLLNTPFTANRPLRWKTYFRIFFLEV